MKPASKPHLKLASGLVIAGAGIITLERLGLSAFSGNVHIASEPLIDALVLVPLLLIAAGVLVFIFGGLFRRK